MIVKVAYALQELIGIHRSSNAYAQTATSLTDKNAFSVAPPAPVQWMNLEPTLAGSALAWRTQIGASGTTLAFASARPALIQNRGSAPAQMASSWMASNVYPVVNNVFVQITLFGIPKLKLVNASTIFSLTMQVNVFNAP